MKKFVFILIALVACLTIQAQAIRLDNSNSSNVYVVQQHIDVGITIQPTHIYTYTTLPAKVSVVVSTDNNTTYTPMTTTLNKNTAYYYTSCTGYRRGVGLINTNANYNTIKTINLVRDVYTQNNYKNVQKYYCN